MTDIVTKLEVWGFQTPNNLQLAPFGYSALSGAAPPASTTNIRFGSVTPTNIYYGTALVQSIYYGSTLVWQK